MEYQKGYPAYTETTLDPQEEERLRQEAFERYDRLETPAQTIGNLAIGLVLTQGFVGFAKEGAGAEVSAEEYDQTMNALISTVNLTSPNQSNSPENVRQQLHSKK